MTHVDYSAARVVLELKQNLTETGVELAFARVQWDLKADFDRHHLTEAIGERWIFHRLHDAVAGYEAVGTRCLSGRGLLRVVTIPYGKAGGTRSESLLCSGANFSGVDSHGARVDGDWFCG